MVISKIDVALHPDELPSVSCEVAQVIEKESRVEAGVHAGRSHTSTACSTVRIASPGSDGHTAGRRERFPRPSARAV
jgi:hypothetical protein